MPRKSSGQKQERDTRESADRYRLLMSGVKDYAIITLDLNGLITDWNEGAERIKGYRPEEIIGKHYSLLYLAEDQKAGKPGRQLEIAGTEVRDHHAGRERTCCRLE